MLAMIHTCPKTAETSRIEKQTNRAGRSGSSQRRLKFEICRCEHIQVTLDIVVIKINQNYTLTPGDPMVSLFEWP